MNIRLPYDWIFASLSLGLILGGGGVYWYTYTPARVLTRVVAGPSKVITRKIIVYRNNVVASKTLMCGSKHYNVTAKMVPAKSPVTSRSHFNANRIVLHINSYSSFVSFRQKVSALFGYAAVAPLAGAPQGGISLGVRDRFARVGPVRFEGQAVSVGAGVFVMVDARVGL